MRGAVVIFGPTRFASANRELAGRLERVAVKRWLELVPLLERAVNPAPHGGGLHDVAVLSPSGEAVGTAGALADYEVRALAALVSRGGPPDLLRTLFDGELAKVRFDQRPVFLGIAGRCVFMIAVGGPTPDGPPSGAELSNEQAVGERGDTRAPCDLHVQAAAGARRDEELAGDLRDEGAVGDLRDNHSARSLRDEVAARDLRDAEAAGDLADEEAAGNLRDEIEQLICDSRARLGAGWVPPTSGPAGSSSPAEAFAWPPRPREPWGSN